MSSIDGASAIGIFRARAMYALIMLRPLLSSLVLTAFACGERVVPPPVAPEPPLVMARLDAGAAAVKQPPQSEPVKASLTCPTPAVADDVRSCASATGAAPTMQEVVEADLKALSARVSPKLAAKPRARKGVATTPAPGDDAKRFAPRRFEAEEERYLQTVHHYLCSTQGGPNRTELAYGEAQQYFEARHWEEAGVLLRDVALGPPSDVAIYAAQLSLESFNILAATFSRPDCNETLRAHLDEYIARLCTTTARPSAAEGCEALVQIRSDVQKHSR